MNKFRAGDKVKVVSAERDTYWYASKIGNIYTLKSFDGEDWVAKETDFGVFAPCDLELYQDEKESTSAWLKENPWYIKVNNKQEFLAAVKWLEDHNQVAELSNTWLDGIESLRSSNNMVNTYIRTDMTCVSKEKEIILNFKVILESVQLPEAPKPTEQELRIIELEKTIAQASAQIKQLKEMN